MFMKKFRSVLAFLLVLSLLLGLGGTAIALAAETEVTSLNYVSLGDTLTSGFGLTGYENDGYMENAADAYPAQFAALLEKKGYAGDVALTQLAVSGQLPEELYFLLSCDYVSEGSARGEAYQTAVSNADIVSIASASGNFSQIVLQSIEAYLTSGGEDVPVEVPDVDENKSNAMNEILFTYLAEASDTLSAEMNALTEKYALDEQTSMDIMSATVNALVDAMVSYKGIYRCIMEANPDVQIIQVAMMDCVTGQTLDLGDGKVLDMDVYLSRATNVMNVFLSVLPTMLQNSGGLMDSVLGTGEKIPDDIEDPALESASPYADTVVYFAEPDEAVAVLNGEYGVYPTAEGHDTLTDALTHAYSTGYTSSDNLVDGAENHFIAYMDSKYVAIGDSSAFGESYTKLLAERLCIDDFTNLAQEGAIIEDAAALIAEKAALFADADLVTVGYGGVDTAKQAMDVMIQALLYGNVVEYDWESLIGESAALAVEMKLADLEADFVEQGMDDRFVAGCATVAEALTMAVESYAYNTVVFMRNIPEVVGAIHDVNPDALVTIVGMGNPFNGSTFVYEGNEVDVAGYFEQMVTSIDLLGTAYAMLNENVAWVCVPNAETEISNQHIKVGLAFFVNYVRGDVGFDLTDGGHAYIRDHILDALSAGCLGDVNVDGYVDSDDATLILKYDVGLIGEEDLNLVVADVNSDGYTDSDDATLILKYDVGLITVLPADRTAQ